MASLTKNTENKVALKLQQAYGAGLGWSIIKAPKENFDIKAILLYQQQQFYNGVESGLSVVMLSGPVGAGKTTVARELVAISPAPLSYIEGDALWPVFAKPDAKP